MFGEFIKIKRVKLGYSIRQLCRMINEHSSNWSCIERESMTPPQNIEKLKKIASVLKIKINSSDWYKLIDYSRLDNHRMPDYMIANKVLIGRFQPLNRFFMQFKNHIQSKKIKVAFILSSILIFFFIKYISYDKFYIDNLDKTIICITASSILDQAKNCKKLIFINRLGELKNQKLNSVNMAYLLSAERILKNGRNNEQLKDVRYLLLKYRNNLRSEKGFIFYIMDSLKHALISKAYAADKSEQLYQTAMNLMDLGSYDEAVSLYNKIIKISNNTDLIDRCYFNIAWCKKEQNKYNEALNDFDKIKSKLPIAQYEQADIYYRQGKINKAIKKFDELAESTEDQEFRNIAQFNAAYAALYELNDLNDAQKRFEFLSSDSMKKYSRRSLISRIQKIRAEQEFIISSSESDQDQTIEKNRKIKKKYHTIKKITLEKYKNNKELQNLLQIEKNTESEFIEILIDRIKKGGTEVDLYRADSLKNKYRTRPMIFKTDKEYHEKRKEYNQVFDDIEIWLSRHDKEYKKIRDKYLNLK